MTRHERAEYLAKVIILAESDKYFEQFETMVFLETAEGFFDKIGPGDPSSPEIADLDNPIDNGISTH
jgi:hypothetical protein